jgi:hypothetical protein
MTAPRYFTRRAGKWVEAPPPAPPPRGLGDLVATVANPIARASDALFGTHLVGCGSCAKRRAALNRISSHLRSTP